MSPRLWPWSVLEEPKRVSPWVLGSVVAAVSVLNYLVNFVIATPTLVNAGLGVLLVVGGLLWGLGSLSADDLGLRWRDLPRGVSLTVAAWIAVQVTGLAQGGFAWTLHGGWQSGEATLRTIGRAMEQFFGNALYEEIVFRGFMVPQFYLLARRRVRSRAAGVVIALLVSQAIFAAVHLPHRLAHDLHGAELAWNLVRVFINGVLFALLFLSTGNLFAAVGLHALFNHPLEIVAMSRADARALIQACIVVMILLCCAWRFCAARQERDRYVFKDRC